MRLGLPFGMTGCDAACSVRRESLPAGLPLAHAGLILGTTIIGWALWWDPSRYTGAAFQAAQSSFDFILSTVPEKHDINPYIKLLKRDSTICVVGPASLAMSADAPVATILSPRIASA